MLTYKRLANLIMVNNCFGSVKNKGLKTKPIILGMYHKVKITYYIDI